MSTPISFWPPKITQHNRKHKHSTTGLTPDEAWDKALAEQRSKLRTTPDKKLLDLHFALHLPCRVSSANTVEFLGRTWNIAPTQHKNVLIIHHPLKHFRVVTPATRIITWPDILASYSL
jgi:hypothetical protein